MIVTGLCKQGWRGDVFLKSGTKPDVDGFDMSTVSDRYQSKTSMEFGVTENLNSITMLNTKAKIISALAPYRAKIAYVCVYGAYNL